MGIPLVGLAPVERWKAPPDELPNRLSPWIPEEFFPHSIYPEARTVIVIGIPVALPIVETAPSIYYHELYKIVNAMLDSKANEIATLPDRCAALVEELTNKTVLKEYYDYKYDFEFKGKLYSISSNYNQSGSDGTGKSRRTQKKGR
jgi:epoxyqueuosine reductase QueG